MTCISESNFRGQQPDLNSYVHKISREDGAEISLYQRGQQSGENKSEQFLEVVRKGNCIVSMGVLDRVQLDDRYQLFASWSELEEGASGDNEGLEGDDGEGEVEGKIAEDSREAKSTSTIALSDLYELYQTLRSCHLSRKDLQPSYLNADEMGQVESSFKKVESQILSRDRSINRDAVWTSVEEKTRDLDMMMTITARIQYNEEFHRLCRSVYSGFPPRLADN